MNLSELMAITRAGELDVENSRISHENNLCVDNPTLAYRLRPEGIVENQILAIENARGDPVATHMLVVKTDRDGSGLFIGTPFNLTGVYQPENYPSPLALIQMVRTLKTDSFEDQERVYIGFNHLPVTDEKAIDLLYQKAHFDLHVYQTPFEPEVYRKRWKNRKYRKLWNAEIRELGTTDLEDLMFLTKSWIDNKSMRSSEQFGQMLQEAKTPEERERAVRDWRSEMRMVSVDINSVSSKKFFEMFQHPLSKFYGLYMDGEMQACVGTFGNHHFVEWHHRKKEPEALNKAARFLDLRVCEMLTEKGVSLFGRGYKSDRVNSQSLMDYKRTFGPLDFRWEISGGLWYHPDQGEYRVF